MKGGGGRGGGGGGPSSTITRMVTVPVDLHRLARHRGYLQQELIHIWNRCARCEHDARYHLPGGPKHNVCDEFQAREITEYLPAIAEWEFKNGVKVDEIDPDHVNIGGIQRRAMAKHDAKLAELLKFDWNDVDETELSHEQNYGGRG